MEHGGTWEYKTSNETYSFTVYVNVRITDYERRVVRLLAADNKILAVRFIRDKFGIGLRNALTIVNDILG